MSHTFLSMFPTLCVLHLLITTPNQRGRLQHSHLRYLPAHLPLSLSLISPSARSESSKRTSSTIIMPATRVTLTSNTNQSQKTLLLIPASASLDPNSSPSCYSYVIKAAQSKLRLKKALRVFVLGGQELTSQKDWKQVLKDDVVLLVSIGEEYVGSRKEDDHSNAGQGGHYAHAEANPDCSIENLAQDTFIDSLSITQFESTARNLPGMVHAVAQPDLHPGTKFPIGAIFVSQGWIHPPLIGGDIGCGMAWFKTRLSQSQVEGDKGRKIAEKLRGLDGAWRTQKAREIWLENDENTASYSAGEEWDAALGTIGAGNHFAELQVVEESLMKRTINSASVSQHELYEGDVVLLVHSGSRGYGSHILKQFTKDGRESIREDDPIAKAYLEVHDRACSWASRNRDLIALRFLACLEPGEMAWDLGTNDSSPDSCTSADDIRTSRLAVQARQVVDIYHNNVEATIWPPSLRPDEKGDLSFKVAGLQVEGPRKVYVHRKGAAPTHDPKTNIPLTILPLPGSRATPTLIVHPTFTSTNAHGQINALSLAHGAGRALSRAKAATYVAEKYAGQSENLLRGDFVKADKRGNKQFGGADAPEEMSMEAAGLCARRSNLSGRKRLKPTRTCGKWARI